MKSRRETIIGYRKAKEALENGYEIICYHAFRGNIATHLFDPGSQEICERVRADAWSKLRLECHMARGENYHSKRSKDYFWKLGPAPKEPKFTPTLVPLPGAESLADLKQNTGGSVLNLYTYGCSTYGGQLVTIKIPATDEKFAGRMAHQMMISARELIDIDEGLWLNDEHPY